MPQFAYVARDGKGVKVAGADEAHSSEELVMRLQAKGLFVVSVKDGAAQPAAQVQKQTVKFQNKKKMHSGVNAADMVLFCRQFATLLGAGVTVLNCLKIFLKQVSSRKLFTIISAMIKDMEAGLSLHEAMAKHPRAFSDLWVNLVESGEASGNLAIVLSRLAAYLERNEEFKKKIISALIYPCILMVAGLGALLFLTIKIIPTFSEMFKGFNVQLPILTVMLMSASELIRKYALGILIALVVGIFFFRQYIKTKPGRKTVEQLLFKLPMLGEFFQAMAVERFSSGMSTLVESGVPILYSLEISERSCGNLVLSEIIHSIKDDVRDGKPLSQQMEKTGFFEPMVIQMINVGEEIGELPQMFKKINEFYQDYVSTSLTRFTAMFEPMMLLFMGGVIGLMVIGIFLPIFKIAQLGSGK